jgi:CubicO group peptidase (beta-lactamase class C family)
MQGKIFVNWIWFCFIIAFFVSQTGCTPSKSKENLVKASVSSGLSLPVIFPSAKNMILNSAATVEMQNNLQKLFNTRTSHMGWNCIMLVAKKGVPVFEEEHGFENFKTKTPISDSTIFHIASMSKPFTAAAILKLVQEKKVSLSDNIKKYIPQIPYDSITVKDLLSHRSGLLEYLYASDSLWKDKTKLMTNEDVANMFATHHIKLLFKPGTHFHYANTNYVLLALVIEKASGKTYPQFMHDEIFAPLGLTHTFVYDHKMNLPAHTAQSYLWNGQPEPMRPIDGPYGDKNIYSTASDILRWDQFWYTDLFLPDSLKQLAYTPTSLEMKGVRNYGLGWRMLVYPSGNKIIFHNGWWYGNNTVFNRFIDDTTTLIILSNRYNNSIYDVKPIWTILGENPEGMPQDEEHAKELH